MSRLREQVDLLNERGLADDHHVTDRGHGVAEHLIDTARMSLNALVADWAPAEDPRLNEAVARVANELAD